MPDAGLTGVLVQGGAVGIVIALLLYMAYKDKNALKRDEMHNITISNHFERSNIVQEKTAESNVKLAESLVSLKDIIKQKK